MPAPRTILEALRVRSTGFLDDLDLQLSPALNCLIGARGTGKTSLLELIRFATGREDETPRTDRTLAELVPAALGDGGSVELDISTPLGQRLTVTRSVTGEYTVDDRDTGEPADVDWPPVGVYSFDIFSQNQLEDIAMDPRARIRMLDLYSGSEIDSLQRRIADLTERLQVNATQLIQAANEIETLRERSEQLPKLNADLDAIEVQYQAASKEMKGNEKEKNQVDALAALRQGLSREDRMLTDVVAEAETALLQPFPGQRLGERLRALLDEKSIGGLPNADRLREVREDVARASQEFARQREIMKERLVGIRDVLRHAGDLTQEQLREKNAEYRVLSNNLGSASERWKKVAATRDSLLTQVRLLESATVSIENRQNDMVALDQQRSEMLRHLADVRRERYEHRREAAATLNEQIGETARIVVTQNGNLEDYQGFLIDLFKGSGMWYTRLATDLAGRVPPGRLAEIARAQDVSLMAHAGELDEERARKAVNFLASADHSYRLEMFDVDDSVNFELRTEPDAYLPTESLSQGQRCTTVLSILLVESSNPLIIDQPEDNLDNSYVVASVVSVVARQKAERQFIFVTHNPNIPVLAEAEKVVVMMAPNGHGAVACQGAWQLPEVRQQILRIMEGGIDAFRRRERAYSLDEETRKVAI